MEGHIIFSLSSLISAHKVPDGSCHGLMSSEAASGELCLSAVAGSVSCSALWRIGDSGKRLCTVSKGVPCLCEVNKPSVTQAS